MIEKRQLKEDEANKTQKGIEKNQKTLKEKKETLNYSKALIKKQQYMRDFDDKWRVFLRKEKDKEDQTIIKNMEDEIKGYEKVINIEKDKIKNGVEKKDSKNSSYLE